MSSLAARKTLPGSVVQSTRSTKPQAALRPLEIVRVAAVASPDVAEANVYATGLDVALATYWVAG